MATRVRAIYQYDAQAEDELSLKEGDVVVVAERYDDGWCKGEFQGRVGVFPGAYTVPEENSTPQPTANITVTSADQVIATIDFEGKETNHLSFKRGDVIKVLDKFPTGWWKGELNGKVGIFPKDSVSEDALSSKNSSNAVKYIVIYPFKATLAAHLDLETNQEVTILEELPNGWVRGEARGKTGIFPAAYVKKASEVNNNVNSTAASAISAAASADSTGGTEAVTVAQYEGDKSKQQLSFTQGMKIWVLGSLPNGWAHGRLENGETGIYPAAYAKDVGSSTPQQNTSYQATVIHPYKASGQGQLELDVGQVVTIMRPLPNGWAQGEIAGKIGVFPSTFVKKIDGNSTPSSGMANGQRCVAVHEFAATIAQHLAFNKGDIIIFHQELPQGWSKGEKDGKIGLFPSAYVRPTDGNPTSGLTVTPTPAHMSSSSGTPAVSSGPPLPARQPTTQPEEIGIPSIAPPPKGPTRSQTHSGPVASTPPNPPPPRVPAANNEPTVQNPPTISPSSTTSGSSPPPPPPLPPPNMELKIERAPSDKTEKPKIEKPEKKPPPGGGDVMAQLAARLKERKQASDSASSAASSAPSSAPTPAPAHPTPAPAHPVLPKQTPASTPASIPTPNSASTPATAPATSSIEHPHLKPVSSSPHSASAQDSNYPANVLHVPNVDSVDGGDESNNAGNPNLKKIKRALTTLQNQTKTAVEGMLKRLDQQQKEILSMWNIVRTVGSQAQENKRVIDNVSVAVQNFAANPAASVPGKSGLGNIHEELELERRRRSELEALVNKLQSQVEQLDRKVQKLEGLSH